MRKILPILILTLLPVVALYAQSPKDTPPESSLFDHDHPSNSGGRNLLQNGNFEHGTKDWELIAFAKKGKMEIDTHELHEGRPTLRVDNVEGDQSYVRQIIRGKPNTRYRLTGYIKTRDVEPVAAGGRDGAVLLVGMSLDMTQSIQKTTPWRKVTLDFTPKNPNEIRVGGSLGTYARYVTGTAWFSDLTLTEIGRSTKR